ncbi:SpaA isopeptide-forming pilin-related protein [Sporosarcina koreensis]|uniref:SpaA isopeptide-forming pilin-related protein n=1 Tax=Sporosarcina koreensis TaxID=334735 RepID=UPI000755381B|nr:SpaA isopeptide-forming pilin-related protein [Sporosarcina koreensis]
MKKVYVFMLMLLLIGQTILGPMATVSASEIDPPITSSDEDNNENPVDDGDPESEITEKPLRDACGEEQQGGGEIVSSGDTAGIEIDGDELVEGVEDCEQPTSLIMMSDNDPVVDPSVIHTITPSINLSDPSYRPKMGDELSLELQFTLPSNHNYGEGSTLTYELPEPLKAVSGSGDLYNGEFPPVTYASFVVSNGQVVITFNDEIRFQGKEGSGGIETTGYFNIQAKFESDNKELEQDLILPNNGVNETKKLHFQPTGGAKVKKSSSADNGGANSRFIKWTVEVNTVMDDLGTGVEFTDTLRGKHKYDPTSLKVTQKTLGTDGSVIGAETDVTSDFSPLNAESNDFTLSLTGKYAYTIEYQTIPDDSDEAEETLGNTGNFNGASDPQSTTIKYGSPLSKSVSKSGEKANWTIKVNENRRPLEAGLTITDTWKTNADKHELVGNINVSDLTLNTDYEVTTSETGFVLKLLKSVSDEFTITYTTKPKDLVTGDIPIKNEVVRSDRQNDKKNATASYSQNVITKSNSNINYQSKTVDWTIVLNSARYTMSNIVLDDVFEKQNLKIVDGTFKVMINGSELPYEFTDVDGTTSGDKKGGFKLEIDGPISDPITITYTTEYVVRGATNLDTYTNVGNLKWEAGSKTYNVNDITSTVDINNQQKGKGYKTGNYNYEHKKFEWSVGINYNFDEITNAIFTDTLSDSQVVDRDSIKVYKLDLTSGGDGVPDEENPLSEGADYTLTPGSLENSFTITFNKEIVDAYLIVYESRNKHDFYAPNPNKETVKNNAELTGTTPTGSYSGKWNREVTVEHTEKLITKNASQVSGSARFNWTMNLNWGQSTLKNAVITDTIGNDDEGNPNQIVNKDSFQICEMNFKGTNSAPNLGTCHEPGTGLYDISFENLNDPNATFEINFNQEELTKAYVVKYETYFLGASGETVVNKAHLSYGSNDETSVTEDESNFSKSFNFSGGADAKKGQLVITKVDKDNEELKLSGAEFELWSAETDGFLIERVSTDADGVYTFQTKVGQGNYYLVETQAPSDYNLEVSEYKNRKLVPIKDNGDPKTPNYVEYLTVKNEKIEQSFELVKTDSDGNPLEGVEFELRMKDANGQYIIVDEHKSLLSNDEGEIYIDGLEPGDYQLIEIKTKDDSYWLDKTPIEFTIVKDQMAIKKLTMKNYKQGELIVEKVDAADSTIFLKGAVFELVNKEGNQISYTATTGDDGIAKFTGVKYGSYILKEITPPQEYVGISEDIEIEIDSPTKDYGAIRNEKIHQAVKLVKVDGVSNETLKGAEFVLYDAADDSIVTDKEGNEIRRTTDDHGEITVNNLEPGEYYFLETRAPEHYFLDTDEENRKTAAFTINKDQTKFTDVTMDNKRGKGSLIISKEDAADGAKLSGTEFELTNSSGDVVGGRRITDSNGQIEYTDLPYDIYKLKETKAKAGYVIDEKEHTIVVSDAAEDGKAFSKTITNKKITHSVHLTKYNADKLLVLPNAVFELRMMNESLPEGYEVVTTIDPEKLVTDENGKIYLDELDPGDYQFVETKAPSGYYVNKEPVSFTITENQTETVGVEKTNTLIPDPVWPVEPGKPVDPEDPGKPVDPTEPGEPNRPGEDPTNPGKDPSKPVDPDKPGEPNRPGEDPKNPDKEDPTDSEKPGKPGEENPSNVPNDEDPITEEKPITPGKPSDKDDSNNGPADNHNGNVNNGTTDGQPDSSTTGTGDVESDDGSKVDGQNVNASGKDTLPQTGEQHLLYMIILGFALMVIGGFMVVRRKSVE